MPSQPLFAGLIVDEFDRPVDTALVGSEPCYVVDDAGFRRHIPAEQVDRQVLNLMRQQIEGHEDLLSAEAAKMLGTEDIFSKALLAQQLKNLDQQFETLLQVGFPEEMRAYLGMIGFKVVIDLHGQVLRLDQPGAPGEGGDDGGG
ncbi:MAG: hypothetical protein ABWK53_09960 [Anaerolineales bacterium]